MGRLGREPLHLLDARLSRLGESHRQVPAVRAARHEEASRERAWERVAQGRGRCRREGGVVVAPVRNDPWHDERAIRWRVDDHVFKTLPENTKAVPCAWAAEDGRWTLWHGDCLDVMAALPTASVDLVVTDPPYIIGAVSVGTENAKSGTWADMENAAFWFGEVYRACLRVLKPTGAIWTFLNWRSVPTVIRGASLAKRPVSSLVVWDKEWISTAGPQSLRPCYEMIALIPNESFLAPDRSERDIWPSKWSSQKPSGHPAEKPWELAARCIRNSGLAPNAIVLDPFCGSGSFGVGALAEACRFVGVEREAEWVDKSRARIEAAAAQGRLF
jgi:DNA modification methylase